MCAVLDHVENGKNTSLKNTTGKCSKLDKGSKVSKEWIICIHGAYAAAGAA